jgi:hypothetical protein
VRHNAVTELAKQTQLLGTAQSDVASQTPWPHAGDESLLDRRKPTFGRSRRNPNIASKRQLEAAPDEVAMKQADNELIHRLEAVQKTFPRLKIRVVNLPLGECLEIYPRGEGSPRTAERNHTNSGVPREHAGNFVHLHHHVIGHGIERFGPVERYACHLAFDAIEH